LAGQNATVLTWRANCFSWLVINQATGWTDWAGLAREKFLGLILGIIMIRIFLTLPRRGNGQKNGVIFFDQDAPPIPNKIDELI
jgi:hypothetical protein